MTEELTKGVVNPFSVHPPENLPPESIASSFVEMYTDFPKICEPVNLFIHGPRGAGKSIMLRSLEHRVQVLMNEGGSKELPFFAVHVPIKQAFFGNPEYLRLSGWKATTVGEHVLSIHTVSNLFAALDQNDIKLDNSFRSVFYETWGICGGDIDDDTTQNWTNFEDVAKFCDNEAARVRQYILRLPDEEKNDIYSGALTGLNDFVLPLVKQLIVSQMTIGKPVCFMVDDADNLPEDLQKVLNSWISSRVAQLVCFKVTTQLGYKTYRTVDERIIESPHDFSEINIGSVYTSNKDSFSKRIEAIVEKRLKNSGIECSPRNFFESDGKQMTRVKEIWNELKKGNSEQFVSLKGQGPSRGSDYAQRYAIPALMRELSDSKSSHTYSYAGLRSLIDLSSGVVRWFLEPASQMFQAVQSSTECIPSSIPVSVQDTQIVKWSKEFRERLDSDPGSVPIEDIGSSLQSVGHSKENYVKLGNLLDGIGFFCRERLLNPSASEQRVFSFVLSGVPSSDLSKILFLGVRMGYFQKTDLASKNSLGGRRPRYILSRRLGPHYRLDVSGYASHLSVRCEDLLLAMRNPKTFVKAKLKSDNSASEQATIDFGEDR